MHEHLILIKLLPSVIKNFDTVTRVSAFDNDSSIRYFLLNLDTGLFKLFDMSLQSLLGMYHYRFGILNLYKKHIIEDMLFSRDRESWLLAFMYLDNLKYELASRFISRDVFTQIPHIVKNFEQVRTNFYPNVKIFNSDTNVIESLGEDLFYYIELSKDSSDFETLSQINLRVSKIKEYILFCEKQDLFTKFTSESLISQLHSPDKEANYLVFLFLDSLREQLAIKILEQYVQ